MKENIIKRWAKKINPWGFEGLSIYDVTHEAWIISEKRRAVLQYALSEYRGIIVGVFEINDWYKIEKLNRWGFNGKEAPALVNELYLNKSIKHVKKKGAANPIRYRL